MGINLGERYAKAIQQLLPNGIAWQDKGVCTETLLGRLIRGTSEELARFQNWFDTLMKWSIERYIETPSGWTAKDYEQLLNSKFGISAKITDGLQPLNCESHCESLVISDRSLYLFIITVDDLSVITPDVMAYLDEYKQSHTDYLVRDKNIHIRLSETCHEYYALNCESACTAPLYEQDYAFCIPGIFNVLTCESACIDPLYEKNYAFYTMDAHWSYDEAQLPTLNGWAEAILEIPAYATLSRGIIQ